MLHAKNCEARNPRTILSMKHVFLKKKKKKVLLTQDRVARNFQSNAPIWSPQMCKQICEYANIYLSKSVHVYETLESMHVTDFSMLCANSKGSGRNEQMLGLVHTFIIAARLRNH